MTTATRLASLAAAFIAVSLLVVTAQSDGPTVELYDARGEPRWGGTLRAAPDPNDLTPGGLSVFDRDARLADGRLVRGIGLNVWPEGSRVRVRVVVAFPKNPATPRSYPRTEDFTFGLLASFLVDVGQTRHIDEMKKSLGVEPFSVRVFPSGQHAH